MGISINFLSWILGMIVGSVLINTNFYKTNLTHIQLIKNPLINKFIGIQLIKRIVSHTPFRLFNPNLNLGKNTSIDELNALRHKMCAAEINHLIAFILIIPIAICFAFTGKIPHAISILIFNIFMNFYPILLQQENKSRIDKIIKFKTRSIPS